MLIKYKGQLYKRVDASKSTYRLKVGEIFVGKMLTDNANDALAYFKRMIEANARWKDKPVSVHIGTKLDEHLTKELRSLCGI